MGLLNKGHFPKCKGHVPGAPSFNVTCPINASDKTIVIQRYFRYIRKVKERFACKIPSFTFLIPHAE